MSNIQLRCIDTFPLWSIFGLGGIDTFWPLRHILIWGIDTVWAQKLDKKNC